jgi:hypothetical protein
MFEGKKAGRALVARQAPPVEKKRSGRMYGAAIGWAAVSLAFFLSLLSVWTHPEWRRHAAPEWMPFLEQAEAAAARNDRYTARRLYIDAARAASTGEDWRGLLAAACGMKILDGPARAHANAYSILVRAMTVAETARSRGGMEAVARAFSSVGEKEAAAALLGRLQPEWPDDPPAVSDAALGDCWGG